MAGPKVATACPSCKAGPKFINSVKEPGSDRVVVFCGKCHKVMPSTPHAPVDGLSHLNSFVTHLSETMMAVTAIEVVGSSYIEGLKAGVNLSLSVPWSEKENFWMEKYGVVQRQRIKGLKDMIKNLETLEKTAESSESSNKTQLLERYRKELSDLEQQEKNGISN